MRKRRARRLDLTTRLLYALNHPIRIQILKRLATEPASATTLSDAMALPLGNVSYHLSTVLFDECRIVTLIERNQRRGAIEKVYAPTKEAYVGVTLSDLLGTTAAALTADPQKPPKHGLGSWQPIAGDDRRKIDRATNNLAQLILSATTPAPPQQA